jgi:hypothetical protein
LSPFSAASESLSESFETSHRQRRYDLFFKVPTIDMTFGPVALTNWRSLMTLIRQSGGYRKLASFQTAIVIYDATVCSASNFWMKKTRTFDQMVQARSGRQNIAEGSRASATSSQTNCV